MWPLTAWTILPHPPWVRRCNHIFHFPPSVPACFPHATKVKVTRPCHLHPPNLVALTSTGNLERYLTLSLPFPTPRQEIGRPWTFAWIKLGLTNSKHILSFIPLGHFLLMFRASILHSGVPHSIVTSSHVLVNSILLFLPQ